MIHDGGIDRYAELAREFTTGPGLKGPDGTTYPQTGDICVHSQQHNLNIPALTPPTEMFSYTFDPGVLNGAKDLIKLDFMTYGDGPLVWPYDTLTIDWNGTNLEIGVGALDHIRIDSTAGTQTLYSAWIGQIENSNHANWSIMQPATIAMYSGTTNVGINDWMSVGGTLSGTFTKGNGATATVAKLFIRIYKVIGL